MDEQVQTIVEQIKLLNTEQMASIVQQVQQLMAVQPALAAPAVQPALAAPAVQPALAAPAVQPALAAPALTPAQIAQAELVRKRSLPFNDPEYVSTLGNPLNWTRQRALEAINSAVLAQKDKGAFGIINGPYENVRQYIRNNSGRGATVRRNPNSPYTYSGGKRRRTRRR
jgi:hypothetical protein